MAEFIFVEYAGRGDSDTLYVVTAENRDEASIKLAKTLYSVVEPANLGEALEVLADYEISPVEPRDIKHI